ncbi:MAG: Holliday junction resolvase RuvX [Patescibacteria group bacterium]
MLKKGKVLALDYGTKRIGVASGDFEMKVAFPRSIIENKSFDFVAENILKTCKELDVKLILIGLPLSMQEGQVENPILKSIKWFANKLQPLIEEKGIELEFFDERLSSFEAERVFEEFKMSGHDDAHAAQIILQRYFDSV